MGVSQEDQFFAFGDDPLMGSEDNGRRTVGQLLPEEDTLMLEDVPRPPEDTYDMQMESYVAQPPMVRGVPTALRTVPHSGCGLWPTLSSSGLMSQSISSQVASSPNP